MASTLVEVFNLALSACGSEALVSNPDEASREAGLCRLWLPRVRDHVISTAPWPSALSHARLLLHHERLGGYAWNDGDPAPGMQYAYSRPSDMIAPFYFDSYMPFTLMDGYFHSNDPTPILRFMKRKVNPQDWDEQLTDAIIHYLAARLARPLTGNSEIVTENFQIAARHVEVAQAAVAEMLPQTPTESLPDWITARGYGSLTTHRYFYPFQHLNPITA